MGLLIKSYIKEKFNFDYIQVLEIKEYYLIYLNYKGTGVRILFPINFTNVSDLQQEIINAFLEKGIEIWEV